MLGRIADDDDDDDDDDEKKGLGHIVRWLTSLSAWAGIYTIFFHSICLFRGSMKRQHFHRIRWVNWNSSRT